ncbi:hypothetical protein ACFL6U_12215 [Planctomycetota bacterium]
MTYNDWHDDIKNIMRLQESDTENNKEILERRTTMIMPNDEKALKCDKEGGERKFTHILRAAQTHWGEICYDNSNKIARGVLPTENGGPYIGELSYNDVKDHIFLTVRLNPGQAFTATRIQALQRFNNNVTSLGHVTWDGEDQIINVRAASAMSASAVRHAVGSIFVEAMALLENDDLQHLLT